MTFIQKLNVLIDTVRDGNDHHPLLYGWIRNGVLTYEEYRIIIDTLDYVKKGK